MHKLDTLSETINAVVNGGYSATFKLDGDELRCLESNRTYKPSEMTIVDHFRFEGASDPDDTSVLYVLECDDGVKGSIVDAYGMYAAPGLDEFIKKISLDEPDPSH